jgi:hypothetical protein
MPVPTRYSPSSSATTAVKPTTKITASRDRSVMDLILTIMMIMQRAPCLSLHLYQSFVLVRVVLKFVGVFVVALVSVSIVLSNLSRHGRSDRGGGRIGKWSLCSYGDIL